MGTGELHESRVPALPRTALWLTSSSTTRQLVIDTILLSITTTVVIAQSDGVGSCFEFTLPTNAEALNRATLV